LQSKRSFHQSAWSTAIKPEHNVRRGQKSRNRSKLPEASGQEDFTTQISSKELLRLFGNGFDSERGKDILQTLQNRRVDGSLVDLGVQFDDDQGVSDKSLVRALAWLRERYPVDEQAAAAEWAVKETQRLVAIDPTVRGPASASQPQTSVIDDFKSFHAERRKREEEEKKLRPPPEPKALPPAVIEAQKKRELRKNHNRRSYYDAKII